MRYTHTQEHERSKGSGETRPEAGRAAAGTTVTGGIVADFARRQAARTPQTPELTLLGRRRLKKKSPCSEYFFGLARTRATLCFHAI